MAKVYSVVVSGRFDLVQLGKVIFTTEGDDVRKGSVEIEGDDVRALFDEAVAATDYPIRSPISGVEVAPPFDVGDWIAIEALLSRMVVLSGFAITMTDQGSAPTLDDLGFDDLGEHEVV